MFSMDLYFLLLVDLRFYQSLIKKVFVDTPENIDPNLLLPSYIIVYMVSVKLSPKK